MNDYNEDYFWTTIDPMTNKRKYYFKIKDIMAEVPREGYNCCFSSYIKELRYNRRIKKNPILSLDYENDEKHKLIDNILDNRNPEENILNMLLMESIMKEIEQLDADEKQIILKKLKKKIEG